MVKAQFDAEVSAGRADESDREFFDAEYARQMIERAANGPIDDVLDVAATAGPTMPIAPAPPPGGPSQIPIIVDPAALTTWGAPGELDRIPTNLVRVAVHVVELIAFNPPRIGDMTYLQDYQDTLLLGSSRAFDGKLNSFLMTQFSRRNDAIVNGVPFFQEHPVWNESNTRAIGAGSSDSLDYCGQWFRTDASIIPVLNHSSTQ